MSESLVLTVPPLTVDVMGQTARNGRASVHLKPAETIVLALLCRYPGAVASRAELIEGLWPSPAEKPQDVLGNLKIHVTRLRAKLRSIGCPWTVEFVPSVGYKMSDRPDYCALLAEVLATHHDHVMVDRVRGVLGWRAA